MGAVEEDCGGSKMMVARDIFEIAYDLAYGQPHDHLLIDFRTCAMPSCQALMRVAKLLKVERTDG